MASVRKHFWAEHWDFGVWERKPRPLRTSSIKKLKCVCKFEAFTLEELDEHVLAGRRGCVPFKFHRIEELPVRDKTGHAAELQAATAYSLLCPIRYPRGCPIRYPRGPTGERLSLYRSSSVTWCWMGGGHDSNVNIQTLYLNIPVHTYSCTFLYLNPWSPIPLCKWLTSILVGIRMVARGPLSALHYCHIASDSTSHICAVVCLVPRYVENSPYSV